MEQLSLQFYREYSCRKREDIFLTYCLVFFQPFNLHDLFFFSDYELGPVRSLLNMAKAVYTLYIAPFPLRESFYYVQKAK